MLGKWLPQLLLAAVYIFWYSLLLGKVVGWGGKSCLSREGTVSWSSDVPVVVTLVVALSSQGRAFALSPSHCQHRGKGNGGRSQPVPPPPSFLMGTLWGQGNMQGRAEGWPEVVLTGRFACILCQGSPDTGGASLDSNMPAPSSCIDHQQFSRVDGDTWVLSGRPQCWGLQF